MCALREKSRHDKNILKAAQKWVTKQQITATTMKITQKTETLVPFVFVDYVNEKEFCVSTLWSQNDDFSIKTTKNKSTS